MSVPLGGLPLTQHLALHLVVGAWEERQVGRGGAWGGSLQGDGHSVGLPRDHTSAEASEQTCEALLLKDKGGIEVTRATSFGTLREGCSRSLVVCIE